jgi:hypothetical protein
MGKGSRKLEKPFYRIFIRIEWSGVVWETWTHKVGKRCRVIVKAPHHIRHGVQPINNIQILMRKGSLYYLLNQLTMLCLGVYI